MSSRRMAVLVVAAALALAGCAPESGQSDDPTSPTGTAEAVEIPDTPDGRATQWVLEQLAARSGPSVAESGELFAPVFLAEIPAAGIPGVFAQLRSVGPFTVTGYVESGGGAETTLSGPRDTRFVLSVSTDSAELIQGLFLRPAPALPDIDSLGEAAGAVASAATDTSFLVADVTGGDCEPVSPVAGLEVDTLRPVGSVFKLYVLGAVVEAVVGGTLSWEDTLTITDELRSLPSGRLQDEPTGTEVSVLDAAGLMIAISDNTATDLLVDAVGRDAVEAAVASMGHSAPEVLRPFVTTREMFQLAFTTPERRAAWERATGPDPLDPDPVTSDRQRATLEDLPGGVVEIDPALLADAVWPLGLDWFATARDVCRAHVALQELADSPAGEPVREILSANPGLTTAGQYDHVGFKGGSAPGEIAGSWYVESGEQRLALVVQVATRTPPAPDGAWLAAVADQTLAIATG